MAARDLWQRTVHTQPERLRVRLQTLEQNLGHLNPLAVLDRGYAIVSAAGGEIIHEAAQLAPGDDVNVTFARGEAGAKITKVER
jgi:exodeoxyribonuclease VII large subunit